MVDLTDEQLKVLRSRLQTKVEEYCTGDDQQKTLTYGTIASMIDEVFEETGKVVGNKVVSVVADCQRNQLIKPGLYAELIALEEELSSGQLATSIKEKVGGPKRPAKKTPVVEEVDPELEQSVEEANEQTSTVSVPKPVAKKVATLKGKKPMQTKPLAKTPAKAPENRVTSKKKTAPKTTPVRQELKKKVTTTAEAPVEKVVTEEKKKSVGTKGLANKRAAGAFPVPFEQCWRPGTMVYQFHELLMKTPMTREELLKDRKKYGFTENCVKGTWNAFSQDRLYPTWKGWKLFQNPDGKFQLKKYDPANPKKKFT
jgi:hypothetical protein